MDESSGEGAQLINLKLISNLALLVSALLGASQAADASNANDILDANDTSDDNDASNVNDASDAGDASGVGFSGLNSGSSGTAIIERFEGPGVLILASCMDGYVVIDKYAYGQVFGILLLDNGTEINVSGQYLLKAGLMEGDRVQLLGQNKYRIKSPGRPDDAIEFDQGEIPELEIERLAPRIVVPMDHMRDGISGLCQRYRCQECEC